MFYAYIDMFYAELELKLLDWEEFNIELKVMFETGIEIF
jgi:hypothetical protein